ncbi:MAG: hypothetical protein ACLP0J_08675 [Solirubrobacteraceae bacterium]
MWLASIASITRLPNRFEPGLVDRQFEQLDFPAAGPGHGRHAFRDRPPDAGATEDLFCLAPSGVRAGYPSPRLLASLSAAQRRQFADRVIWATTANLHCAIDGVRQIVGGGKAALAREFA